MKIIITLIFILIITYSLPVKADFPGSAYQYDRYSENEKFYFKSIPYYNYDLTNFGKTIIYDNNDNKEIYTIENYLPSETFISNNGKSLVSTIYWLWGHSDFEDQILINIYLNGKISVQYRIDELVSDKSKLQNTTSHTLWYDKMFAKDDTLYILTLENKVVKIDILSGKIIEKSKLTDCNLCSEKDNIPLPKTIYYRNIKYPEQNIFPDLTNGNSFRSSLIKDLEKTEVKEYAESVYYIMVYGIVDKNGNCEILMLRTSVNEKEDKEWEKKVGDWVKSQKYQTNLIPMNCEKWVFQDYFYLK